MRFVEMVEMEITIDELWRGEISMNEMRHVLGNLIYLIKKENDVELKIALIDLKEAVEDFSTTVGEFGDPKDLLGFYSPRAKRTCNCVLRDSLHTIKTAREAA